MANFKSTQETNRQASPPVPNTPKDADSRVYMRRFEYLDAGAAKAAADTLELVTMKKGEKLLGGKVVWEAGGAGAQFGIGTVASAAKYLAANTDVSAAGQAEFAHTHALSFGEEYAADTLIRLTFANAAFAANKKIHGYVLYTRD